MSSDSTKPAGTLGTFGGVFTPSILTILGLVLFLRVAFVVGSVGLVQALIILGLATTVSVLTSISLAVVATNMRVGGGGEYYLISRTLGIEFGGAIGVVLYLAISVSIAFYSIGFAEALVAAIGWKSTFLIQVIAAGLVILLAGIGFVGSDLATRLQYIVMVLLVIAIASFLIGAIGEFDADRLSDNLSVEPTDSSVGFWEAFAIFFPAVTGFSQGVAMSGDLRNPSESITRGTFAAVGFSTVVYLVAVVLLAGGATSAVLVTETSTIMGDLSIAGWTLIAGVLAATLSSALASTLGAPRVLQRLGEDRVLPGLEMFSYGSGPFNNPRRALGLSVLVALATVAAGDLNAIAPIISMFFLASYGMINYATYYEMRAGSTSFRPRFRWGSQRASLLGTIACVGAILAINPLAGLFSGLVLVGIYSYLKNRDVPDRWVNSAGSHHYTRAREHLLSLDEAPLSSGDWRPCLVSFVPRNPKTRSRLLTMSSWLEGETGFLTAVRMVDGTGPLVRRQAREIERELHDEAVELCDDAFARVLAVDDASAAVQTLMQSHGIGNIRPNLALFGARDLRATDEDRELYGSMLQSCVRFGSNVAVGNVRTHAWERFERTPRSERTIALWWSDDQVGQLITLLSWLCQRHDDWSQAKVTAFVPADGDPGESVRVTELLEAARIKAEVVEVDRTAAAFAEAMSGATMALAPLRVRRGSAIGPFEAPLGMLLESLPLAVMVLATEELALNVEPDEGTLVELAEARDQAKKAHKWAAELDEEAAQRLVAAESIRIALDEPDLSENDREILTAQVANAEAEATKAFRTYVDARARCKALDDRVVELAASEVDAPTDPDIWLSASSIEP